MISTRLLLIGAIAFAPAFAQVSALTEQITPHRHSPILGKAEQGNGTVTDHNWAGYAVTGTSFTSAVGSWIVPSVDCSGDTSNMYAAFWVGIDGYSSNTVEQTGTESDCDGTNPRYYTWYEFYPARSYFVPSVQVQPGDKIYASVTYSASSDTFTVTVTNQTTGASFSNTTSVPNADRSSAEWVTEAPAAGFILPESNFGTAVFGMDPTGIANTNTATSSTASGPIGAFPTANIFLINKTGNRTSPQTATCSALSNDGTSFSCTWASQ